MQVMRVRRYASGSRPLSVTMVAMGQSETKVGESCAELGITRQTLYRHVDPKGQKGNLRTDSQKLLTSRNLLDDWTVAIRYGRTGQGAQEKRFASPKTAEIRAISDRPQRRLSASKRIGCPYRLTALSSAPGFDVSAWLLDEVVARFFQSA